MDMEHETCSLVVESLQPSPGLTPYEVVYGKPYGGSVCEYGEPVLGFERQPSMVQDAHWQSGEPFLLFDGTSLVLTRSVRRAKCNWVVCMAFYKEFNLHSWQYKVGLEAKSYLRKGLSGAC